ncbi:MAG: MBL fold metallo-hydrolase [Gemmatimonadetes bacterium]|nr:MBL fold metallo-hydrolase [Gemmatimonadota bacterium]
MTVSDLRDMLDRGDPVTVIDIRFAEQHAEWTIPGSRNVDVYEALQMGDTRGIDSVTLPADRPVVAVCNVGRTSLLAVDRLRRRGLDARSLEGGMQAWSLAWNVAPVAVPGSSATVLQVRRTGKGCLSYLIGAGGEAAVIDPSVDPDVYAELAKQHGWRITVILDTHVHADHLSRARVLAELTGATQYLPDQQRVKFPFTALRDGDEIAVGGSRLRVLSTPGHTFESACYLLDGAALFTGDTLFVNAVGRPDLKAGDRTEATKRAHALWGSLQKIAALPSETLVLSCHTSEPIPFDRRAVVAPLAEALKAVAALGGTEKQFVKAILGRIPATPPNHLYIVGFNENGEFPPFDPAMLEAGANRCAVA